MWNWRRLLRGNYQLTTFKNSPILARHPAWNPSIKQFALLHLKLCISSLNRCRLGKYTIKYNDKIEIAIFLRYKFKKKNHLSQLFIRECAFVTSDLIFLKKCFRLFLAAMHFNENSSRQQSMTKDGNKQYAVSYPKGRGGEGVAKEVKVDQTFSKF